ncbi:MAG TPA: PP2C family protein-serine/threonine phosphatase, partial [Chthoniobacterales bacterium]
EPIASSAPPLGLLEHSQFVETHIELQPGDVFFLYTDGLYGAAQEENPRLSSARLAEMLQPIPARAQTLLDRVLEKMMQGDSGRSAPDDVAAVAVRRAN